MKTPQVTEAIAVPTISHVPTVMTFDKAVALAESLNADLEDEWTYSVQVCIPPTHAKVVVHDEENFQVGFL